uniref:Metalloendopeptidase n=1 Tax=Leptobrachium leishanense TaxID=445787 RepID=A0A8C5MU24_9ANUR
MEQTKVLVVFVAVWSISMALPVLVDEDTNNRIARTVNNNNNKTAFENIEDTNKGVVRPLVHGDIAIKFFRSAVSDADLLWPASQNGVVFIPYVISSDYPFYEKWIINDTINQFNLMTCLKFVTRTTQRDYVSIESGQGCWSYIGKVGGKQVVNLDRTGCMGSGTVQHELMHALGFYHEQSRSDRDNYVTINYQFIDRPNWPNFEIEDTNNLGLPYDYWSVMHYQSTAYSNTPGQPTIVAKPDPTMPIGQRVGMSHLDLMKINKLYQCNVCRAKLTSPTGTFTSEGISFGQDGSCLWVIETEIMKMIHLQLTGISIPSSPGCADSYIKIYDGYSKTDIVLLNKTCGDITLPPIISSQNSMMLEFVSSQDPALTMFSGVYKTISYGRTFTRDNGIIISPFYGLVYPNNADAEWSIIAPAQFRVYLGFINFQVEDSLDCSSDSLTVIDGSNATLPVLGTFCGIKRPPPVTSPGNSMVLRFHSDDQTSARGFYLIYRFVPTV